MRGKEEAHDYRYFPDPDLVPLVIDDKWINQVRESLPELPEAKRARFEAEMGLSAYDAEILAADRHLAAYFEECVPLAGDAKLCANWIMGEISRRLNEEGVAITAAPVPAERLAGLLKRIRDNTISGKIAKTVFEKMWQSGQDADTIIAAEGLRQVTDTSAIEALIEEVIAANPGQAAEYRAGKEKLMGFFVGQVMKASKGKANPGMVNQILKDKLSG